MDEREQIAWIIDPEAFSEETRRHEASLPDKGRETLWPTRRTIAIKKAGVIIYALRNGS